MTLRVSTAALGALVLASGAARAEDRIPGHTVRGDRDGLITGSAALTSVSLMTIPVREKPLWSRQLFELDDAVVGDYSSRARHISDAGVALSVAAPVVYLMGSSIDDADGDRLLLYGQSLAINLAVNTATKYLVQRPRPYLYSKDPNAIARATRKRGDGRLSFYSSHAATSFCAAVSGAYLLGASREEGFATALVWSAGLGLAGATANLRVRAGEHFYSDVLIGAVIGAAIGYAVPALHADDKAYVPSGDELGLAAGSLLIGLLASQLIPLEKDRAEAPQSGALSVLSRVQLGPMPVDNGAGFAISGLL